ncbi:unnamed protein product [Durusdinium trenchii]|uniref:Uncharacterized protein n=1 Tax=Durusdinium trenchii TaxID=1381693 RepID=A0ABP0MVB9_9DINO
MPVPSSWTTPIRELREEVHQELQNFSARLAAVEARLASPLTPGGEARQRRQSVWKTPTAQTAQSEPSEVTPKSTNRKIWKTNSDAPGTPSNYVETNQPHETWLNANEAVTLGIDDSPNAAGERMSQAGSTESDHGMEEVEVHFEESAWSIPMVLGLVDAGKFDTVYAVVLLFVNCGMQIMFSGILLSDGFQGEEFSNQVKHAQVWRTSVAHDYKYMDPWKEASSHGFALVMVH